MMHKPLNEKIFTDIIIFNELLRDVCTQCYCCVQKYCGNFYQLLSIPQSNNKHQMQSMVYKVLFEIELKNILQLIILIFKG